MRGSVRKSKRATSAEAEAYQEEQAAKAAQNAPKQENPADAAKDGEVVDAEFAEAKSRSGADFS